MEFIDDSVPGQKTIRLIVTNKAKRHILGEIKWYGQWRRYAFQPQAGTIFDAECLGDLKAKLEELMKAREANNG